MSCHTMVPRRSVPREQTSVLTGYTRPISARYTPTSFVGSRRETMPPTLLQTYSRLRGAVSTRFPNPPRMPYGSTASPGRFSPRTAVDVSAGGDSISGSEERR